MITTASSAVRATARSDGWVATQASLVPRIAWVRLRPSIAAQPEPGARRLQAVERAIIGRTVGPDLWRDAALHAADGAKPLSENAFKVQLVKRTVERQLATVAGLP